MDDDALMYAITGDEPPAGMDGMAEATATVAALRLGLRELGDELATVKPRRKRKTPVWVLAAAVVGVAAAGGYALTTGDDPADNSASRSLPGVVACAETIAVGKVTSVSRTGDRYALTLAPDRYLKPETGPASLSVTSSGVAPARGQRALVVVHDAKSVDVFTGADIASEWAWMEKALPGSRTIECPRD